jgi:hypothetical protein
VVFAPYSFTVPGESRRASILRSLSSDSDKEVGFGEPASTRSFATPCYTYICSTMFLSSQVMPFTVMIKICSDLDDDHRTER